MWFLSRRCVYFNVCVCGGGGVRQIMEYVSEKVCGEREGEKGRKRERGGWRERGRKRERERGKEKNEGKQG